MRIRLAALSALVLAVSACGSPGAYTRQDLEDVTHSYVALRPIYVNFKRAYFRGDAARMEQDYRREQQACRRVDAIDRRDSIDPNTNLFQASAGLDNFCNDIESAYAAWQKAHHQPYDKRVVPAFPGDAFKGGDLSFKKMRSYLRQPARLS